MNIAKFSGEEVIHGLEKDGLYKFEVDTNGRYKVTNGYNRPTHFLRHRFAKLFDIAKVEIEYVEEDVNSMDVVDAKRVFETGAIRDTNIGKLDYDGFLSPIVLKSFAEYMHVHRDIGNGTLRDSDNWQKGIPNEQYMKSMWRHFVDVWSNSRGIKTEQNEIENLNALLFNVMGLLYQKLKTNDK